MLPNEERADKPIMVGETTHRRLWDRKLNKHLKTLEEVIKELLDKADTE